MGRYLPLFLSALLSLAVSSTVAAQSDTPRGHSPGIAAQQVPNMLVELEDAFARGEAGEMMRYSAQRIDVTLFGKSELFSRSQAGYVLRAFFDEYPPERLTLTETSGSEGNWFAAGRYWYERGDVPLSVYFRLRLGDGAWELREIRIGRTAER